MKRTSHILAGFVVIALLAHTAQGGNLLALEDAVRGGDAHEVARLIRSGADPNALKAQGLPLLSLAVTRTFDDVIETLLVHGARVNGRDSRGETALMLAVDDPKITAQLLRHGANPNIVDREGHSALWRSLGRSEESSIRMLLKAGADPNVRDYDGYSLIQRAALDSATLRLLLDHGARLDILPPSVRLLLQPKIRALGMRDSSFCGTLGEELPHVTRALLAEGYRDRRRSRYLCLLAEECLVCFDTVPAIVRETLRRTLRTDGSTRFIAELGGARLARPGDGTTDCILLATAALDQNAPLLLASCVKEGLPPHVAAGLLLDAVERGDTAMAQRAADIVRTLAAGDEPDVLKAGVTALRRHSVPLFEIVRSAGLSLPSFQERVKVPSKYKQPLSPRHEVEPSTVIPEDQLQNGDEPHPETPSPETDSPPAADSLGVEGSEPDTSAGKRPPSPSETPDSAVGEW